MLRFHDLSIKKKLLLIILSINIFVLILAFAGFMCYDVMMFREEAKENLGALARLIGHNSTAPLLFDDPVDVKETLAALKEYATIVKAWVFTSIGNPFAGYVRDGTQTRAGPPQQREEGYYFENGGLVCYQPIVLRGIPVGTVFIQSDLSEMYSMLKRHAGVVGVVLVISCLCVLLMSERLQRLVSGPIVRLADLARSISRNKDYSVRGTKEGKDESGQLVDAFNDMLEQIEQQNESLVRTRRTAEVSAQKSHCLAEETKQINLKLKEEIRNRQKAQEELKNYQRQLEQTVKARTTQLTLTNEQLLMEIVERKAAEKKVRAQLKEKSILLGEIHHRVRNNLQVISSLMALTRRRTLSPEARLVLAEARSRIFTMALIHTHLYESDDFNRVNMRRHIYKLWTSIHQIYEPLKKDVSPVINCRDLYLTGPQAIPCALVLNEAITNVFKHAYEGRGVGSCYITMVRTENDRILMRVRDEGVGIPETVDVETTETLGIKLMRNLVRHQLGGEFRITVDRGTDIHFEFDLLHEDPLIH